MAEKRLTVEIGLIGERRVPVIYLPATATAEEMALCREFIKACAMHLVRSSTLSTMIMPEGVEVRGNA
jgi:hypothetical protein